jgi:hypothetical protein
MGAPGMTEGMQGENRLVTATGNNMQCPITSGLYYSAPPSHNQPGRE